MSRANERRKHEILIQYAERFGMKVFIETGTYRGDTVKAMLLTSLFREIHTIEIYEDRVENAKKRFRSFKHIHCWYGDSAEILPQILLHIDEPTLFWLDAHHSGKQIARVKGLIETPIVAELKTAVIHNPGNVLLIDDARYYEVYPTKYPDADYPPMEKLEEIVKLEQPDWVFAIKDDVIRIHRDDRKKVG